MVTAILCPLKNDPCKCVNFKNTPSVEILSSQGGQRTKLKHPRYAYPANFALNEINYLEIIALIIIN